ncbi:polysaccharide pyruvyl transferase family protein [Dyadobacter sandarakinus]|uniref:Polysaccharide pyruvyl transferase family protein n=1 Tax=Dyadobacter sandarakinus TaxID=2747268 RepID=A0ABX7I138_9BACT|nr:polysaccharide pyruvyl transferase family protein [Dyadobacter sandarakinus]QRQ99469.1 polysaccharide pyruvyl transferase family protein [Dyadobacter sandarakinus]
MNNIIFFKPARQTENIGDLLINLVEVDLLRPYGQIVVDDLSAPGWFVDEISRSKSDLRLSKFSGKPLLKTLSSLLVKQLFSSKKNQYYLAIQPGHTSRKGFDVAVSNFKINAKMYLLKMMGCRIVRIGFSIGPFDDYNGWAESFGSKAYHYYAVRDNESLKIAKKYNFKNPLYFPDLAWAYSPERQQKANGDYIVISMRSNAYGRIHDSTYLRPLLTRIREILVLSGQQNTKIVLVHQVKYDREASAEIYESLKSEFNAELIDTMLTLSQANEIYGNAKFIISNRLHVLLLALKCGALSFPLVDVVDNKKITSIFNDNNLSDLILDIKSSAEENGRQIVRNFEKREAVMGEFKKIQAANKQVIEEKLSTVFR